MPGVRLTVHDREVIERGLVQGLSHARIAALIGKHRTTVAREIARGLARPRSDAVARVVGPGGLGGRRGAYRAEWRRTGLRRQGAAT